ncbi:hypothetical protein [Bacillus sp. B15-48]|uniref:hypothetical protein n=1 Tax=Bacillus sp. B15-48 TaxID=1548601 RepID=UPI00193F462D|nr:hypothetical protein [Bacillus sp. B15-48]MBM4764585.1 hypothetical protein [Bacillus sp. B15-48]
MKRKLLLFNFLFALLFLTVACNQQADINMSEVLGQIEEDLRELDVVETTASSFDGESDIKFRLMVKEHLTEEEANILFNKILESIAQSSNHSDVWDYYNGYFDIKSYDKGVIYEATKVIGEDLKVTPK